MNNFSSVQLEEVFRVGSEKYDIKPSPRNNKYSTMELFEVIHVLEANELKAFLDYQIQDCKYPCVYYYILENYINQWRKTGDDKIDEIISWIDNKVNLKRKLIKKANYFFKEPYYFMNDSKKWDIELKTYVNGKITAEILPFLRYGLDMLNQGLKLHGLSCTQRINCQIEEGFDHKIELTERLIRLCEKLEEKEQANNKPTTKPFDRIQWKGTQKELAELFMTLEKQGWIEKQEYEAIKNCFTKSNTIHQVLKPTQDLKTKDKEYENIFTPQYVPKFAHIKENPKQ